MDVVHRLNDIAFVRQACDLPREKSL